MFPYLHTAVLSMLVAGVVVNVVIVSKNPQPSGLVYFLLGVAVFAGTYGIVRLAYQLWR